MAQAKKKTSKKKKKHLIEPIESVADRFLRTIRTGKKVQSLAADPGTDPRLTERTRRTVQAAKDAQALRKKAAGSEEKLGKSQSQYLDTLAFSQKASKRKNVAAPPHVRKERSKAFRKQEQERKQRKKQSSAKDKA